MDKAGRYSPLTIAAVASIDWAPHVGTMTSFLAAAEQAGRDALEYALSPAELLERVRQGFIADDAPASAMDFVPAQVTWWTEGGPRVARAWRLAMPSPKDAPFPHSSMTSGLA